MMATDRVSHLSGTTNLGSVNEPRISPSYPVLGAHTIYPHNIPFL